MSAAAPVAIVGAARTPIGAFLGELRDVSAPQLGAHAIEAAVTRAGLGPNGMGEIVIGCVLPRALGGPRRGRRRLIPAAGDDGHRHHQQDVRI
jgi:acetyl-CoA C-acetyltransferase